MLMEPGRGMPTLRRIDSGETAVRGPPAPGTRRPANLVLSDGARVAVVGGGPAGSFFSYFLLKTAAAVDLDVTVDIYEPRSFERCGPGGCNHCGGIVSESLVQILAAEGINLPPEIAQRGIESYVVHMDVGNVRIASPAGERRIAALYRGNGPRTAEEMPWDSFDGFLQRMAVERGAHVVRKLVCGLEWRAGLPHLLEADGTARPYELLCIASGVNSNLLELLAQAGVAVEPPRTTRTYICEFRSSADEIRRVLGDSMHVFLLDIPRLEFAALIPKGEFVTMCLLGEGVDEELVSAFLAAPEVRRCFPVAATPCVCTCSPLINVRGARKPFADRLVLIGDSGVTRLYKDGIGAAFRTAKAAAATAVLQGISEEAFRRHYWPTCQAIASDNTIGRVIFGVTHFFKHVRWSRRAILRMTRLEQERRGGPRRLSSVLWNMFTGSAPYREIFAGTLHPGFVSGLSWNLALTLRPSKRGGGVR
jgi:flavin-dependent dehydrogenase